MVYGNGFIDRVTVMQKRTETEWQQLFTEYQHSGLSQAAFCRQKKICSKSLNRYKRKVGASKVKTSFVQAKRPAATEVRSDAVRMELGDVTLYLPLDKPLQTAQLIKALQ